MDHMKRIIAVGAAAALATVGVAGTAVAKPAEGKGKPAGIQCMQNGIGTLQDAGLLPAVAKGGVDITFAVEELGVGVREGADISGVPDPIPFSLLLADHRAGDDSLFTYPWC
jgi:hypothetical protein